MALFEKMFSLLLGPKTACAADSACGCSGASRNYYFPVREAGRVRVAGREIPVVDGVWSFSDYAGMALARLGFGRMDYAVAPGLYAVGRPGGGSPVLVSANYKFSFDVLRRAVSGVDAWILVLDSKGVNVWCAAGKGTFGTAELVRRIAQTGLAQAVEARALVVPQLGAPGISAHAVKGASGFEVLYGPVRAEDIREYLARGCRADAEMRRVGFGWKDRLAVAWLELSMAVGKTVLASVAIIGLAALYNTSLGPAGILGKAAFYLLLLWGSVVSGTLATALLLPWLPGRAFSVKGAFAGALYAALLSALHSGAPQGLFLPSLVLASSAVSAYLALNYTGASTFTSLSGVNKEVKAALPLIVLALLVAGLLPLIWRYAWA